MCELLLTRVMEARQKSLARRRATNALAQQTPSHASQQSQTVDEDEVELTPAQVTAAQVLYLYYQPLLLCRCCCVLMVILPASWLLRSDY